MAYAAKTSPGLLSRSKLLAAVLPAVAGVLVPAAMAAAQANPGGAGAEPLQREARLRELQQFELDNRYRANPDVPPGQRALIDYGAFVQFSYLSLDDSANSNHGLRQVDFVPYARLNIDGAQELFARGRIGYRDFNHGDSFDGRGDQIIDGDLDRGYYKFDLRRYNAAYGGNLLGAGPTGDFNLTFQGGRDLVYWANGLVLGQTLDGIILDVEKGPLTVQFVAGVTPTRTVDIDTSRPAFDYNTRRGFYGAMATMAVGEHRPFVYGLIQRDYNDRDQLDLGLINTRYEYNSWYLGVGSTGQLTPNLRYGVELTYEGGHTLSNSFELSGAGGLFPVEQTRDRINALGFDARLDYFLLDRGQTRFSVELIATSGDPDRGSSTNTFNGNRAGTGDNGFNAFGLLNTGLAFSPDPSNLLVGRLGVATIPFPDHPVLSRLQVGADFFFLNKLRQSAPIDEPTTEGERFLGVEPDLFVNWQVTSDLTLALRYGVFFPSAKAFGENDDPRQFLFAGLTFSF
ncbi:MAG TPA: alginate export family protein [Humisphaera sp.]